MLAAAALKDPIDMASQSFEVLRLNSHLNGMGGGWGVSVTLNRETIIS